MEIMKFHIAQMAIRGNCPHLGEATNMARTRVTCDDIIVAVRR